MAASTLSSKLEKTIEKDFQACEELLRSGADRNPWVEENCKRMKSWHEAAEADDARGLVQFLGKKKRKIVYTDFKDEVLGVRPEEVIHMPTMTGAQYAKKVEDYLSNHQNHIVIHRLRTNRPLTAGDLKSLETTLVQIGEDDGESLLSDLLTRSETPSLAHFVRSMVGMDRSAAQEAFSQFLSDRSLTTPQIRFIEMIIDQLTSRGVMDASALYEPPFSNLHAGGPDELFVGKENVINAVFETLASLQPHVQGLAG